ncbi:glycogen debranching N-terminal domain-containing protein [Streptomyces harbinensis]|uniref:amylo-alpha-1,6-glucosidase n=1 Tax=Streptomyces harbinensis TaxID=1176198 RepID=UPI003713E39A
MSVKSSAITNEPQADPAAVPGMQPFLHDACVTLYAPSFAVSRPDGQLRRGVDGFYHSDRRALARLEVAVEGVPLAPVGGGPEGADTARFRSVLRGVAQATADPAVTLERLRSLTAGELTESFEIANHGATPALVRVLITAGTDLAPMDRVKSGAVTAPVAPEVTGAGLVWRGEGGTVTLTAAPAPDAIGADGVLRYEVALGPGQRWDAEVVCVAGEDTPPPFTAPRPGTVTWPVPEVRSADRALDAWVAQSDADLRRLLLSDPLAPEDVFVAAGAPWFATLFGRDSLWAARMLLPLGTDLAASTLRVLARRQGTVADARTQEQPGKILHEVRREALTVEEGVVLPPVYYGTVDATPLWVTLLHDAWRWGLAEEEVAALLPHAEAALAWMRDHGDADGDGFLEYIDSTGSGLANQGWKDSGDSIRFRDGRQATAPIALSEVQGYAYEAAMGGAALLRAFGRPGADGWEEWAQRLKSRFRERFWVSDARGAYPAIALDGDKRPVDSVTSQFGHLLGTGLLDAEESALLAARLGGAELDSGFGLRTYSSAMGGFNPLGYHVGSVWPHDTAIAVHGLTRAGFPAEASALAAGLVRAADAFDARLPELFAGWGSEVSARPLPYPASCRPQAWAAASSVQVLASVLGITADVPGGTVTVVPRVGERFRPLRAAGLRIAGAPLEIAVDADGGTRVRAPEGIEVRRG